MRFQITTRDLGNDPRAAAAAAAAPAAASRVQHVAVGATHPPAALELYERHLPSAKRVMVDGMHSLPSTLRQCFVTWLLTGGQLDEIRSSTPLASEGSTVAIACIDELALRPFASLFDDLYLPPTSVVLDAWVVWPLFTWH